MFQAQFSNFFVQHFFFVKLFASLEKQSKIEVHFVRAQVNDLFELPPEIEYFGKIH